MRDAPRRTRRARALAGFIDRTDRLLQLIEGFVPEADWLDDAETLTYLHSCVSTKRHRVRVPETPMHLDAILVDEPLTGGLEPRLGQRASAHPHHHGLSRRRPIRASSTSSIGSPFPIAGRRGRSPSTRRDATKVLTRIRRQWFAKRKSIIAILKEVMTNEASVLLDTDAHNKALDADAALQDLGSDLIGEAYVTATLTVWDEDPRLADEKLRLVEKVIQGRDFTCMVETVNAIEAWLGSLPGHVYANVRQPPVSTLNLAHMIPLSAVWAGPVQDEHLQRAAAVLRADGRIDAVPLLAPCRRCRSYADRRSDRRRQERAAGADGAAVSPLCRSRKFSSSISADRCGRRRSRWAATGTISAARSRRRRSSPSPCSRWRAIDDVAERAWAAEWIAAILARENVDRHAGRQGTSLVGAHLARVGAGS